MILEGQTMPQIFVSMSFDDHYYMRYYINTYDLK